MKIIKNIIDIITQKKAEEFPDAETAYQRATYQDTLTRDQLRDKLIKTLKERIKNDIRVQGIHVDITTYSGYREKLVLPEVAKFFRELNYHVDLLNNEKYKDINVLIVNWQGLETFK